MWVLDSLGEDALSREVTDCVPIEQTAVYLRLQQLKEKGHVDAEKEGGIFHWSLTERGKESLEGFDFPPADETDFAEYFAGRTMSLNPIRVLETIAREDEEWVKTSTLFEQIDFSKGAIRYRLKALKEDGFLEEDDYYNTHRWRITEAGYERLTDADETLTDEDGTYIWKEVDQTDV